MALSLAWLLRWPTSAAHEHHETDGAVLASSTNLIFIGLVKSRLIWLMFKWETNTIKLSLRVLEG